MQAVKDKIHDLNALRKSKAEARAEEKAEKELARARADISHEVRLAREAEATMDFHVAKAEQLAQKETSKHAQHRPADGGDSATVRYSNSGDYGGHGGDPNTNPTATMGTGVVDAKGVVPPQGTRAPQMS